MSDFTESVTLVRLLIADTDSTRQLLDDAQLGQLLALAGALPSTTDVPTWVTRFAAADALEVIARSEVLVSKKIRTQDLSSDGPAVAAELRAQATSLRAQATTERTGLLTDDDGGVFDVVEFVT